MQKRLHLSKDLSLPLEIAGEAIGILATRGAGKSYTSADLVEELWAAGIQVAVIDPTGVYWGLRAGATEEADGLPIIVLGGAHGDAPLEPTAGALIADVMVDTGQSLILDFSDFESKGDQTRFVTAFAERLYARKARNRTTLHLVIDEADEFAPQRPMPKEARMLGAMERLVRRGRSRGIGVTLITQRSAALNKNVLDVVDTLLAMRMPGPRDRAAVASWITAKSESDELGVLDSLPGLPTGTAWAWSPVRGLLQKVPMRRIKTFDSYATPKPGQKRAEPKALADIDVEKLGREIAATKERAKADDPRELRKQIVELKKMAGTPTGPDNQAIERAVRQATAQMERDHRALLQQGVNEHLALRKKLTAIGELATKIAEVARVNGDVSQFVPSASVRPKVPASSPRPIARAIPMHTPALAPVADGEFVPSKKQQEILNALAWFESLGNMEPSNVQLGAVALIDSSGGHFSNTMGPLSTAGLVIRGQGTTRLTDAGRERAEIPDNVGTLAEYHDVLRARIRKMRSAGGRTIDMFDAIVARQGAEITTEEIGAEVGIDHTGGHFSNTIGPLGTVGLIERRSGVVRPTEILFPPGLD